ncbi:MAG: hypothetical protein GKS00_21915 [Alphaproteobacteria bacterium]|nr:hypothetical protein [Alphaproteobacteria bacterium]
MTSNVEICNVALTRIDRKRITDLLDGSTSANDCSVVFAPTRQELLRGHDWNFARGREKLARLTAAPTYEFDHAYQLPTDWLATRRVHDNEDGAGSPTYRLEGQTILSSADDIYLTYTKDLTDPAAMPSDFRSLFSYRIAEQLAKTSTVREEMGQDVQRSDKRAKSADAIEDDAEDLPPGGWVTGRGR